MIYQVIPKKSYTFDEERMLNLLKSLSVPMGKKKSFFKRILADFPFSFVIDCNKEEMISFYFICHDIEGTSSLFENTLKSFLGNEGSILPIQNELSEYNRTSTLYLPESNQKKSSKRLASFLNESILMTIINSLQKNTRIWINFKIRKGSVYAENQKVQRQISDVELEYILKVQGATKYENTHVRDISSKIVALTAYEIQYVVDYKESYRVSISTGRELMNLMQIPTLVGKGEEVSRIYFMYQGQVTLRDNEFTSGFYVGKLSHPLQKDRGVYVNEITARKHMAINGTTGSGKTSVFEEMARDIIKRKLEGEKNVPGFTLFDPKESAVLGVIDILLKFQSDGYDINEVIKKVRVVDFSCNDYVFPISLLNPNTDTTMIIDFFKSLYGDMKTPQVDRNMGEAMRSLIMDPLKEHTIGDVEKIFKRGDNSYRKRLSKRLEKNMYAGDVINFLNDTKMSENIVNPVLNRINMFKNTEQKKLMFGLTSKYDCMKDIRKWMDEGYILLFNLAGMSKFDINVICGYMSTQYYLTVLKRPSMSLIHLLFVDEAHDVQLPIFHKIGAKGRDPGLTINVMTQFVEQYDTDFRKELFGNINTFISLRHPPEAAATLVKMIPGGEVTPEDMSMLGDRIGYLTTEDNGRTKTILVEAAIPYRYTDGKLVNYKDQVAMQENKEKNQKFARELMARDCLSKEEAEKIVFKNYLSRKETNEYEKELLDEGDSLLSVEKGDQIAWED